MPSFLCPLLYFIDDWMRVVDRRQLDAYCMIGVGNANNGGAWKTPQPLQQGAANAATETDLFTWMKLLFVPAFAAFLLAAALLEDCFFGPHSHSHHPTHPNSSSGSSGIRAWIRQFCNRGPKLTTAYQNQMKLQQASAAASKQFHAANLNHLSGAGVNACNCGANHSGSGESSSSSLVHDGSHSNPNASSVLSTPGSSSSPSSAALSSTSSGSPLSLHLNFNGFNQLCGPLQYYHTFTREDDLSTKQIKPINGKDHALSSPVLSSVASSHPPPSSEFIRITLTNESTGFNQTFALWSGLSFGEILAYYVSQYWNDERRKYDSIEGSNAWIVSPSPSLSPSPAASEPSSSGNNSDADETEQSSNKSSKKKKSKSKNKNSLSALSNADKSSPNHPFQHNPPLILTYKGIRVSPILTPAAIFNPNELASFSTTSASTSSSSSSSSHASATFEISPNYFSLFDRLRVESMADLKSHHHSLKSSLDLHKKLLDEVAITDAEIIVLQKKEKELQDKHAVIQNSELKLLKKNVEKTQKELNQLQSARQDLETTMHHSVGVIRNLKLKLEQEHVGLKDDVEALEKEYAAAKAAYAQAMDARHECSNELKSVMINYENNQKKLNALKVQKIKHEKLGEKVKKIQAVLANTPGATNPATSAQIGSETAGTNVSSPAGSTGPSSPSSAAASAAASANSSTVTSPTNTNDLVATAPQRMRSRYEQLETDHNVLNVHLNELRLASHEIDDLSKNETYKLRYRLKLLEKDLRDLAKWKSVARAHELDARESVRWKLALKQAKNRERALEREAREAAHWRVRARAMEREVRELRNWKRQMDGGMLVGANDDTLSAGSNTASSLSHSNSGDMDALLRGFGFSGGAAGATASGTTATGGIESDPLALALGDNASSYDVDDFADDTALLDQELLFGSNMDKFSSSFPSWYNGAQLNTGSPVHLSRGLDVTPNVTGVDVGAGSGSAPPSNEQDPEFTHTLPAFLAD